MPDIETKYFGTMHYEEESIFSFPSGLPGFENETKFVFIGLPQHAPLVFLQSIVRQDLCFLALPALAVDREYRLAVSDDDLLSLDLQPGRQPALATEVLVLALVSLQHGGVATANLMAPVVVNLTTRRALQAIRQDSRYSHQQAIELVKEGTC